MLREETNFELKFENCLIVPLDTLGTWEKEQIDTEKQKKYNVVALII